MELFAVMITGANRGLGLEFLRQIVQLNSPPKHIFATFRDNNTIQELKTIQNDFQKTSQIHLIQMDVNNEKEIKDAAKIVEDIVEEQGLTLLINNAGIAKFAPFSRVTAENLKMHFNTNTVAPLLLTQVFHPLLKKSSEKKNELKMGFSRAGILNMSSFIGSLENINGNILKEFSYFSYKISKAALNMSMRVIAEEIKKDKIMVILMCPGWVKTDMGTQHANIESKDSIAAMLNTLPTLNETHTGSYIDRFGNPIPY